MAVLLPGKFIFLATPFTGSLQVEYALKGLPGAIKVEDKAWGVGHHAMLDQVLETVGKKATGTERICAFVRNPYDILVLWYKQERSRSRMRILGQLIGRRPSFLDFINGWAEHQPEPFLKNGQIFYHAATAHEVLRYERGTEKEINAFLRKLPGVPAVKVTPEPSESDDKDHWSLYYDVESYTAANAAFQHDFVKYGYQFLRA